MRIDFSAIQMMNRTMPAITAALRPDPSWTVENSSSSRGMRPVSRTVTPFSGVRPRSLALMRMKSDGTLPGWSAV